jgi:hypothetical protein
MVVSNQKVHSRNHRRKYQKPNEDFNEQKENNASYHHYKI